MGAKSTPPTISLAHRGMCEVLGPEQVSCRHGGQPSQGEGVCTGAGGRLAPGSELLLVRSGSQGRDQWRWWPDSGVGWGWGEHLCRGGGRAVADVGGDLLTGGWIK